MQARHRVAELTGSVSDERQCAIAVYVVRDVDGVSGVLDRRQIRRKQRDAPAKHRAGRAPRARGPECRRAGGIDMDTIIAGRFSTLGQAQHCAERRPA
ncbi:hypothetical protein [Burkholderia cepacia]|uniref:hypothetical protein n=1 Tax=Burkholderia cepacia TaxID=292 RepID=UPI001C9326BC|nr:hypothetical protein [Burkholderia cepacia]MBY4738938.1 hypothetical protein [Burkholderia cepacia]MBY4744141.1 hypothetical protein [Burkholderia cepacia]MBY4757126.1 hypothetical protein [Burkholderia cepacia]MBY4777148.1 hypothetical protein [Burkholderia cepacia]